LPMPRGVLHASMISASTMVLSFRLLLPPFEDDRVLESIHPADNLFRDPHSCLLAPYSIVAFSVESNQARSAATARVAHLGSPQLAGCQAGSIYYNPDSRSNYYGLEVRGR
jgi:hypothetical protein